MLRALLLDWLGQFLILFLIYTSPSLFGIQPYFLPLQSQGVWILFIFLLYPLLGWLFGTYTLLRWRRVTWPVLLQRLLTTSVVTLLFVGFACLLINPSIVVWVVHQNVLLTWIGALSLWALAVRVGLRRGLLLHDSPRILLLAHPHELDSVLNAWCRVPHRFSLEPVSPSDLAQHLDQYDQPILLALSQSVSKDPLMRSLLASLETRDPRQVRILSVISLFEQQQERLPPGLLADIVLTYDDLPWASTFSIQVQLKRMADLLIAAFLLFLTSPFVFLAALLIYLEDQGPVFYAQQRSGWLGRPFTAYKLRTMSVQPPDAPACWTEPGDQRITAVGKWLRRLRLDELPQLFNVINGEMSLIGPRPERPELEDELEQRILHYRKRHWMRPGLSGWAQVCAPYASTIEASDLKLSYDLFYLRHFSLWLDLVILLRTVKTVLKAGGR